MNSWFTKESIFGEEDKLPTEHSIQEALQIYGNRLIIIIGTALFTLISIISVPLVINLINNFGILAIVLLIAFAVPLVFSLFFIREHHLSTRKHQQNEKPFNLIIWLSLSILGVLLFWIGNIIVIPTIFPVSTSIPSDNSILTSTTTNVTCNTITLYVSRARGARIFNQRNDDSQNITYIFNPEFGEPLTSVTAYAYKFDEPFDTRWFFVENTVTTSFGWVMENEVTFDRSSLNCLPVYSRQSFPINEYPIAIDQ